MSVRHPQSEEQELLVEAVRTLAREQIAPHAAEVDKRAEFPFGAVALLRQNDVFALAFAEEYGGTGTGTLTFLRAVEELSYADATVGLVLAVQSLGAIAIELAGSPEQ
jgi:alkylation response protein AidB-like acyl-CoA dehydrogenase